MHSNAVVINDVCSSFVQRTDGRIGRIYMAEANTAPVDTSAVAKAVELAQQLRPTVRWSRGHGVQQNGQRNEKHRETKLNFACCCEVQRFVVCDG